MPFPAFLPQFFFGKKPILLSRKLFAAFQIKFVRPFLDFFVRWAFFYRSIWNALTTTYNSDRLRHVFKDHEMSIFGYMIGRHVGWSLNDVLRNS